MRSDLARPSIKGAQRRAYLLITGSLLIVMIYFSPRNSTRRVKHVNTRIRNAVKLLLCVSRVSQSVFIDYTVVRIG